MKKEEGSLAKVQAEIFYTGTGRRRGHLPEEI